MKEFPSKEVSRNIGDLWSAATVEPVTITKNHKPRFVLMSVERYEALIGRDSPQTSVAVADMPDELGKLFDQGVEEHFRDR